MSLSIAAWQLINFAYSTEGHPWEDNNFARSTKDYPVSEMGYKYSESRTNLSENIDNNDGRLLRKRTTKQGNG